MSRHLLITIAAAIAISMTGCATPDASNLNECANPHSMCYTHRG